jgi:hypothetical protein
MLKSNPMFKKNSAHLIGGKKKKHLRKKNCSHLRFECFKHVKTFLFMSSFEHVKFAIDGK